MKYCLTFSILLCIILPPGVTGENRILSEVSDTSTKWQFRQFSTQVEQNMETVVLPNDQLLFVQSQVDESGFKKITLQRYLRDSTKIGEALILGNSDFQCTRPKVTLIKNVGFALGWIGTQIEQSNFLIQIFSYDLIAITQSQVIGPVHLEVHWDMVSEFHYLKQISGTKLQLFYKPPNVAKTWNGLVFDYSDNTQTDSISLPFSKILEIAINKIATIVVLQIQNNSSQTRFTIMNIQGQISRTEFSTQQYNDLQTQRRIIALSNNNFLVLSNQGWSSLFIYDSRFSTILRTNSYNYYYPDQVTGIYTSWEYQNYFVGGLIQLQALEESFVVVGVDIYSFKFRLVHLKNSLEFIQFREVHYENLNIYKYFVQQTGDNTIFVQWIDGLPETLLPEYKQSIYQSELDLQLSINNCSANCEQCLSKQHCLKCSTNFNLINNQCESQCIENCKTCSNPQTCQICNDGYFFDSQLKCVQDNNNVQEVRISNSDTTNKKGSKFKILDNRNIVIIYREQDQSNELLQIKLVDQYGNQIFNQQLVVPRLINYDFLIQDSIVYVYVLTQLADKPSQITVYQYSSDKLDLLQQIQLPQLQNLYYFNFQYFYTYQSFFKIVQFLNTYTIVFSGFQDYNWQRVVSYTYDYNGNMINNNFYGDFYVGNLFFYNSKQFDVVKEDDLMYIIVATKCDLQLTVQNEFGGIIRQDYYRQYFYCQYYTNPSISITPKSQDILIAFQDAFNEIQVISWFNYDQLYSLKSDQGLSEAQIIALDQNSFILLYLLNDNENNYVTINYLHYDQGQILDQKMINQHSIQPIDISFATYYDNDYLFVAWTGFKNGMEVSANQIYLQQISISDDKIVGLVKTCGPNCSDCQDYNVCSVCNQGYYVTQKLQCQLVCIDNCYYCEQADSCKVCNVGYEFNNNGQCIQTANNLFTKLSENLNRFELNAELSISNIGNIMVSWISYDTNDGRFRAFIKAFDQHGNQQSHKILDVCFKPLQTKLFTMNENNLIAVLCDDNALRIAFFDDKANQVMPWQVIYNIYGVNAIPSNNHFDIAANDFNQIFVIAQTSAPYQIYYSRIIYDPQCFCFGNQYFASRNDYDQEVQNLKISVTADFIYYSFSYLQYNPETGINQLNTKNFKGDYNFNEIQNEIIDSERQLLILYNNNILKVSKQQTDLQIQITTVSKQLFQTTIRTQMNVKDLDIASFQHGFIVVWTQSGYDTDFQITLNAQVFFNNGTQITEIAQLPTFSPSPSNPIVESLKNGEFIIVWNDIDPTGQSLFAARYNKYLTQIPLTSVICQEYCEVCLSLTSCQRCFDGYYVDNQTCKPQCTTNCVQCTVPNTCEVCQVGYFLQDITCVYDQSRVEEEIIATIQDIQNTRVSITCFSDNGFVVSWNDNQSGVESIFFQFYDNERKPSGEIKTLQGDNDRIFAQVKSLADDKLAVVWFDGDCSVQCRLVLQIFDQQLSEYTSETIIALLTLPYINNQSPVQIQRQDNKLIIAYLSYENSQTTAYYAIYQLDSLSLLTPIQIETTDVKVDNLDIIVYNSDIYCIVYVLNSTQLKSIINRNGEAANVILYDNTNIIETPTHNVNYLLGNIIIAWSEKQLIDNRFINKIMYLRFDSLLNSISSIIRIENYYNEYLEQPKLINFNDVNQVGLLYRSFDISNQRNKRITYYSEQNGYRQVSSYSYIHKYFQIEQLQYQDVIVVDIGLNSQNQPTIFIQRIDLNGNALKMGDVVCPENCQQCQNNHSCQMCADQYFLWNGNNGNYCVKQCSDNFLTCSQGYFICQNGYYLTPDIECLPLDQSKTQKLINTQQYNSQENQKIATLSNYFSVVVWQSKQQNLNGVSIYMQKFDPYFTKVGPETLITKDGIGIQQAPNIAALPNNNFVVIWRDSNADNAQRILMQKFSFDFEKVGQEAVVFDQTTSNFLQDAYQIYYDQTDYKLETLQNGNLVVLLRQSYIKDDGQSFTDLRLKYFDQDLIEYDNQLIGQTSCCNVQDSITSIENTVYIIWINIANELKIVAVNSEGDMVNGQTIGNIGQSSLAICSTEIGELVVGWVNQNILTVQRYDQQLNVVGNSQIINLQAYYEYNWYLSSIQLKKIQGGVIVTLITKTETPWVWTDTITLQIFDNYLITTSKIYQINDYRGQIMNIQSQSIGNGQFVITWEQILFVANSWDTRSERDSNGWGLYVKRFDSNGNVLPITNIICQSNCNQCSKENLCLSCLQGYQFDSTQSICQLPCPDNCLSCSNDSNWRQMCNQCKDGYVVNGNRECDKITDQIGNKLYVINDTGRYVNVFDQVTLQNGNIVIFYYLDNCQQIFFKIIDNQGVVIVNEQSIWSGGYCALVRTTALTTGHFAIVHRQFQIQDQNDIWLHVYDINGVLIRNQVIYNNALWNYYYWWGWSAYNQNALAIKQLANGGFIIIYMSDNNGKQYIKPKLYLRSYGSDYLQITNDIQLQSNTITTNNGYPYYWDWWNRNSNLISIVETETSLIVMYNYNQQYWWNQNQNKVQITKIDKADNSQVKKFLDINNNLFGGWPWWYYNYQNLQMYQIEENKFVVFRPFPQGLRGIFLDHQFNITSEKVVLNTDLFLNGWYNGCPGCCPDCCPGCWNQQQFQLLQLDSSFFISYYQQKCQTYQCVNAAKIMPFSFNLEKIAPPKELQYVIQNSLVQSQSNVMKKYLNNNVLLMSVFQYGNFYQVGFDKFDSKGTKLSKWELNCPVGCRNCQNLNNQIICIDCQDKYWLDDGNVCKLNCEYEHCLTCNLSGTKKQYCIECEIGYTLRDNSYCVQKDPNQIVERKLEQSINLLKSVPKMKVLMDGTIVTISLIQEEQGFVIYGQSISAYGNNVGELIILQRSPSITNFDFSVSSLNQIIVIWTDESNSIIIRGQKYDTNFVPIENQIVIFDQIYFSLDLKYATVEFLQDNSFVTLIYGGRCLLMNKYDWNSNLVFQNFNLGYWDSNCQYYWGSDFNNYYLAPQIVFNQGYMVVLFQNQEFLDQLQIKTFDLNANLLYATSLKYNYATQPQLTFLENGNLAIVWKDQIHSNEWLTQKEIPYYQESTLLYVITDPQFTFTQFKYIGMDYVNEENPDIQSIPNGFAISWSGTSEKNSQHIDLRVVYFDLNGNQQTGFLSVSSICSQPTNSQITSLRDGSIAVSWYQNNWIYMQKLDRNGVIQQINTIVCSQNCRKCESENTCDICLNGFQLNQSSQCVDICLIENCALCQYSSYNCRLCNNGYFMDESLQYCNPIDQSNSSKDKLWQTSKVYSSSTIVITNSIGDLLHIWIDDDSTNYLIFGESYTSDGSLIISRKQITILGNNNYQMQVVYNEQYNTIILLLVNQSSVEIIKLNDNFEIIGDNIELFSLLQTEFTLGFDPSQLILKSSIDGFAIIVNGKKKKLTDQFGLNPQIAICDVLEILLLNLNGNLVVPAITFWSNEKLGDGFLDANKQCYKWDLKDVVLQDQIYVILSNIDDRTQIYIQIYDYNGQKIRERRLSDFVIWDQWWKPVTFKRNQLGEFNIIGQNSQLIRLNSQFDLLSIDNLGFTYDNEIQIISLTSQYLIAISKQQQYLIKRYKLWVYDLNAHVIIRSDFISNQAVYQGSFTQIVQSNGNLIFTWQEIGQNSLNLGNQYIVRFDQLGQWIKFEQFSCLLNCSQCQVATKCDICSDDYYLDQNQSCLPTCSDNCKSCSIPLTCDICNYGYYSDDFLKCQSKEGQPNEKPISSQTSSIQIHVRVAQFSDGSSVIVWQSDTQDGSGFGVYAQKIDSAGNKSGNEIRVNINVKGQQYFPDVTTLSNGNIIIIWVDGDIESQAQLYYQQFDNDLNRIGSPVYIDQITVPWITYLDVPCVVQSVIGKQFGVIWINYDTNGQQITFVTVIDENGIRINTNPIYNYDSNKEIVVSSNGFTFVVIYRQQGIIQGSIFDQNGVFQNTVSITTTISSSPGITVDNFGQYIIAWQSDGIIYYQIFEGSGLQGLGQPFSVQIIDGVFSDNPDIVAQSNGFVIVWQNKDILGKRSRKIRIQLFDKNGVSLGDSIEVDINTIYGEYPQLSLLNNDEFVVVWSAQNIDSNIDEGSGIYMIKFSNNGIKLSLGGITCPNRCQNCSNQDTCIKCVEDYQLVSGVCVPQCADNCGSCNTPLFCDICQDGYKLDPSGYCSFITPDLFQEGPLLALPLLSLPSFSSSTQIFNGVIVYSGSVTNIGISYYLEINLQLIAGDNSNQLIHQIPIASTTTNIIHSDIIIRDDKSIQVYWIEVIREVIRIKVITISFQFEIIEKETVIDTIWITDSGQIHDESRVFLYYQNSQYYVIHSVYTSSYNYDVYQHAISTSYVRITQPVHIMVLQRQISYTQILFSIDNVVFLEYTETFLFRTYRFSIDFVSVELRETSFDFGFSNYANSFMLRRLRSGGYVVCWRSYITWSLSSRNYIYYTMFNDNLDRVSDYYVISQSNGVLGNPLIIVQDDRFAVIWNNQISVSYSQLSISYYTNYGGYISTTTQLNTISNNIQYYYATITVNYEIIINWISRITIELIPQYQYFIIGVNHDGYLIPSPSLVCQSKCSTCNNQYTCLTCATDYYYAKDIKDCLPLCPTQCKTCQIPTACQICNPGYTLNTTTNLCEKNPCNKGCNNCNLNLECHQCEKNYILNLEDMKLCIPTCPLNCEQCTVAPICDKCSTSYYWSDLQQSCLEFMDIIKEHPRKDPLRATFPTKDYVEMWIQEEPLPGIYFQLYKANGTLIGGPTKVNMDNTTGNRRLLQDDIDYKKKLFSDLATFQDEFVVVWVDQTIGDLKVKFKKFNIEGKAISDEITIKQLPKQRLEDMKAPCQIQKANGDNFVIGFLQKIEEQIQNAATMFIQSFNKNMEPLGKLQTLTNIDYKNAAMISASEDGRISITFQSKGYVYLTQISMEGNYLYEPMKVADGKAFKSTNLKDNKIVFVFEAVSTNTSPPQYILEFEIMNSDKKLSDPIMISTPQYGEEHPFVTTIASDFIIAWRTIDITLKSQDILFQLFDEFGNRISQQIKVDKQGLNPKNPSVQVLNQDEFYITWTGESINKTDEFYTQAFKKSTINNSSLLQSKLEDKNITNKIICTANCIICENSKQCNICSTGYYEQNGLCEIDCGINCQKCSKSFECDICQEGYIISLQNTCELIDCEQGYKLNENYECVPSCSDYCTVCESFNICLNCQESFELIEGKCQNNIIISANKPDESISLMKCLSYILVSILLLGVLILITWYYKNKKPSQRQLAQPQQVQDERQETYLDSTSSRVN